MKSLLGLTGALLLAWTPPAQGQDWTRFRGPDGLGLSPDSDIPTDLRPEKALWQIPTKGHGQSCVIVYGNKLFYTVAPEETPGARDLVCASVEDGKELWRKRAAFAEYTMHKFNSPASTSPAADAERVYLWWNDGEGSQVMAFDHEGAPLWKSALGTFESQHGGGSSVVVVDGVLLVQKLNLSSDSFVAGLDPATGKTRWKKPITESAKTPYDTPVIRDTPDGKEAIYVSTERGIFALDVKTGAFRWEHNPGFDQRVVSSAVISGDYVFASCGSGGGGKDSVVLHAPAGSKEVKEAYRLSKQLPYVPTGLGLNDKFFLINDGGVGTCYEASTGKQLWRSRVVGKCFASLVAAGERIYAFGRDGDYKIFRRGNAFEVIAEGDFEEPIDTTPSIADGKLFIRTGEKIYCFQKQTDA